MEKSVKVEIAIIISIMVIGVFLIVKYLNLNESKDYKEGASHDRYNESEYYGKWSLYDRNIDGKFSNIKINSIGSALKSLEDVKHKIGIESINDELVASDKNNSGINDNPNRVFNYFYFDQLYNGIEVYQSGLIVFSDLNGNAEGIVNSYKVIKDLPMNPKYSENEIKNILVEQEEYDEEYIIIRPIVYCYNDGTCELAYYCSYDSKRRNPLDGSSDYIFSANTGEIISKTQSIYV